VHAAEQSLPVADMVAAASAAASSELFRFPGAVLESKSSIFRGDAHGDGH